MSTSRPLTTSRPLVGIWLGRRSYRPVYDLQVRLMEERKRGEGVDRMLLVEHDPVITLGRTAQWSNLLASPEALENRGVELVRTDRGGDVTLHGPGQLVGYPIVDLRPERCDVRRYVRDLAFTMNQVIAPFDVQGGLVDDLVGLWVDPTSRSEWPGQGKTTALHKIGAIGVRLSRWVTMHGFALNLSMDLDLFRLIVPCGISQHGVTTLEKLHGDAPSVRDAADSAFEHFSQRFEASDVHFEDWSQRSSLD
ncbi:MAG: lipoyl(octanoyl) transferase LipB [Polyangiaceae bacterium]|nr:lipoyl(octanoyl) transferase LipB [Polyangiaceae bacterium]